MIFLRATIHGFGKWTDTSFDFSTQPLISFVGENEAGKSTLQQFLLYMVFGLPPRKRKAWQPKYRNEIGGTLTVKSNHIGVVTIRRTEDQCDCLLEDGSTETEAWWGEQLEGLTREVYTSIYAFSALDLGEIRQMKKSQLSDVLFSVGLTGSSDIYQVEKKLDAKLEALYKKQGKKPEINEQINRTAAANGALEQAKAKEADYHPLMEKQKQLGVALQNAEEKLVAHQKARVTVEKIIQLHPVLQRLEKCQKELRGLPNHIPFPEYGIERLQENRQAMIPIESALAYLQESIAVIEEAQQERQQALVSEQVWTEATELLAAKASYEQLEAQQGEEEGTAKKITEQYEELLRDLDWEIDKAELLHLPFHLEASWEELQREQREIQREKQTLSDEHVLLDKQNRRLETDIETARNSMMPEHERQKLEQALHEDRFTSQTNEKNSTWQNWTRKRLQLSKRIFLGAGTLAIITFLFAWLQGGSVWYFLSAGFFGMGMLQYLFMKNNLQMFQQMAGNLGDENHALSPESRAELLRQKQEEEERKMTLDQLLREQQESQNRLEQWAEKYQLFEAKQADLEMKMTEERRLYPFLGQLEVAHWLELLRRVRTLKTLLQKQAELKAATEKRQNKLAAVNRQLMDFPYGDTFSAVQEFVDQQTKIKHFFDQQTEELASKKQAYQEKQSELKPYQEKVRALFTTAEVTDEEAFFVKGREVEQQQELTSAIAEAKAQIRTAVTEEKAEELFKQPIQLTEVEEQLNNLLKEQNDMEDKISGLKKELYEISFELKQLEAAEDPSTLAYRFQIEKDALHELAEQWAVTNMAKTALQKAKQTYQEKYMTAVIEWTTLFFQQLTDDAYTKVFAPEEGVPFQVEGKADMRYTVEELSQGTIDQLYTALRFAIAKVMSKHVRMPLLIDDAFVHFDDTRAKEAMRLMKEIAKDGQIIFFTYRSTLVDDQTLIPMNTAVTVSE